MPPRRQHPAKGWAAALDRTSLVSTDLHQDSSENQQRLNRQTAQAFGLRLKPGYDFSEPGKSARTPITRRKLERGINAVVNEKAVEALLVSSVDRLSRLGMRHVGEMLDAVDAVGGRIIFNKGNLDSSQPASRAIIAFLSEQARDEANMLSWRIETWREGCRLKGKWTGRVPYGFSVIDGKRFEWDAFDNLAVPGGSWFEHANGDPKHPAILFIASDEPALKCFHLFKKWGRDAAGDTVKLA